MKTSNSTWTFGGVFQLFFNHLVLFPKLETPNSKDPKEFYYSFSHGAGGGQKNRGMESSTKKG